MQNRHLTLLITVCIFIFEPAFGQKLVNSPFARFNIGTMEPAGSFRSIGMGGIGTAMRDNSSIYFSNPASYSSIDTNSFIFDFGLDYGINLISENSGKYSSEDMNFDHLLMGFPITKGWGIAMGVYSLSNGYYALQNTVDENSSDYDPVTGSYVEYHGGDGSLTNFFLGTGLNITKNISAGMNMSILFGKLTRTNQFDFADYYNVFNDNSTEKLRLSAVNLDYGLQYAGNINKDYFINAGISLSSGKHCKSEYEKMAFRYTAYGSADTILYQADDSTRAFIPGTLRVGLTIGKKNKFVAGIDFVTTKWTNAKISGTDGYFGNTQSLLFGMEYIPEKYSNYSFVKRMEYRIGGHIEDNYLVLYGDQVKEYGMSLGVGIPMRRTLSKTNFFIDYTKKSVFDGPDKYKENYITFGVSLNMYDYWFIKRKYD